jgi:glycosyltransferase involved in cell wall biosynthesis
MNKISYLVPCFNHHLFILHSLSSILQDAESLAEDYEIIIIDDGSSDGTDLIIKEWLRNTSRSNIRVVFRENRGLCSTLNELLEISTGDIVRLCSSDDLLMAGSTKIMLNALLRDDLDCILSDALVVNDLGDVIHDSAIAFHGGSVGRLVSQEDVSREIIKQWCIAGPSSLLKKSVYSQFAYTSGAAIDDFDFYLSMISNGSRLGFLNIQSCRYRVHGENTSKTAVKEARVKNLKSFLISCRKYDVPTFKYRKDIQVLISLTEAKVAYLQRSYYKLAISMAAYYWKRLN